MVWDAGCVCKWVKVVCQQRVETNYSLHSKARESYECMLLQHIQGLRFIQVEPCEKNA